MVTLAPLTTPTDATAAMTYSPNQLYQVPLAEIQPDPAQPRKYTDPAVPKNVLAEIARKKQERSMVTAFKKYRDQQAKAATKADAGPPAQRKRTKAETIVNGIGVMAAKIGGLELSGFSAKDRAAIVDAMTSLKGVLGAAISPAVKNKKKPRSK